MKRNNIFNPGKYQRASFKAGWSLSSSAVKAVAVSLLLVWIALSIWVGLTQEYNLTIILVASGISLFISYFNHRAKSEKISNSMLAALSTENGDIAINGESLPRYVRKLVLGKDPDNKNAFIQLAWNSGDEWRFDINEYDAVAEYFARHRPDITVVKE